jgi:hypothetical protein
VSRRSCVRLGSPTAEQAERVLKNLARRLDHDAPGVSASIYEGLDEMLARLKILAKCCRIGVLSYISLVFPPVFTTCDLEAEFWVAEADMQLISVPYNHRVVRYRIGLLSYSILPVF